MTNDLYGNLGLNCLRTHETPGIEIDWVPWAPSYEGDTVGVEGHYDVTLRNNAGPYASRVVTVSVAPEQYDEFCMAFRLQDRKANDQRDDAEEKEQRNK